MPGLCDVAMHIEAPPPRAYASAERALALSGGHADGGGAAIQLREPPHRLVWQQGTGREAIALTVTFQPVPGPQPGTALRCELALPSAGIGRRTAGRLLRPLLRRRMLALARQVRALAEGDRGPGTRPLPGGSAWRQAQGMYRGLLESCAPGLHAAAAGLLARHLGPPQREVLDLGAGSGAWLARLRDAGYTRLTAVELHVEGFGLPGVTPLRLDLNRPFGAAIGRRFGLVTAIEIIEHLDCPRAFLREVHPLLADGGFVLVSTPNIACWQGRLRFLRRGEHRYFEEGDYQQRHISPMTDLHMHLMFREVGFDLVATASAGSFDGRLRAALLAPAAAAARALWGPRATGDVTLYLLRRATPAQRMPGTDGDYLSLRLHA